MADQVKQTILPRRNLFLKLCFAEWRDHAVETVGDELPCVERGIYQHFFSRHDPSASINGFVPSMRIEGTGCGIRKLETEIEERWRRRFGADRVHALREAMEELGAGSDAKSSRLFGGLEPRANGWQASLPPPETLP